MSYFLNHFEVGDEKVLTFQFKVKNLCDNSLEVDFGKFFQTALKKANEELSEVLEVSVVHG